MVGVNYLIPFILNNYFLSQKKCIHWKIQKIPRRKLKSLVVPALKTESVNILLYLSSQFIIYIYYEVCVVFKYDWAQTVYFVW